MLTTLLVLLVVAGVIGTVGLIAVCFEFGFFFWLFAGADLVKCCLTGIIGLICAISDANS
jgi:hypothetical protein